MKKLTAGLLVLASICMFSLTGCGGHEHDFSTDWAFNDTHHYHECMVDGCNEVSDKAEHTYDNVCDETCDCGYVRIAPHDYSWVSDDDGHYQECSVDGCEVKTTKTDHVFDNDCDEACDCGYTRTVTHDFTGDWQKDDEKHWHVCKTPGCGVTDEKLDHDFDQGSITKPASPTENGEKTFTCNDCGKTKVESFEYTATQDQSVTKTEWETAMNYSGNLVRYLTVKHPMMGYISQTDTIYGDLVKMNDNTYLVKHGDNYYNFYLSVEEEEGTKYDIWVRQDGSKYQYDSVRYLLKPLADQFDSFTYNTEDASYTADSVLINQLTITNVVIKFNDGVIETFIYEQPYGDGKIVSKYEFRYNSVQISLPSEMKTPHVCNYEWLFDDVEHVQRCRCYEIINEGKHAFDLGVQVGDDVVHTCLVCGFQKTVEDSTVSTYETITNNQFIQAVSSMEDVVRTGITTITEDGEVVFTEYSTFVMASGIAKHSTGSYYSKEGDKYYLYTTDESDDGTYSRFEITEEDYYAYTSMSACAHIFDSLSFDENTGLYVANQIEIEGWLYNKISFGFKDGKVVYLLMESISGSSAYIEEFVFSYETCEVTLPPLHTCSYTKEVVPPTCSKQGYDLWSCECGNSYKDNYTPATREHNYVNGVCTSCGIDEKVGMLSFEEVLDEEGQPIGYSIIDCDTSISGQFTIPEEYNGLPIIKIGNEAFRECNLLTKLILPENLYLSNDRFYKCDSLQFNMYNGDSYLGSEENPYMLFVRPGTQNYTVQDYTFHEDVKMISGFAFWTVRGEVKMKSVEIPNTIISIGQTSFNSCPDLTWLTFEENSKLEYISDYAFADSNVWGTVILPDTVKHIGKQAFGYTKVMFINIPDKIETISENLLINSSSKYLYQIVIPTSVKKIEANAFVGFYHTTNIYYEGTPEQWEEIQIHSTNNYYMQSAKYFYYSETEPTDTENGYWYYSQNGAMPLIWGDADNDMKDYILGKADILHENDLRHEIYSQDGLSVYLAYKVGRTDNTSGQPFMFIEYQKSPSIRYTIDFYFSTLRASVNYYLNGTYKGWASAKIDGETFTLDTDITFELHSMSNCEEDLSYMLKQSFIELNNYLTNNEVPITFDRIGLKAISFN